MPDDIREDEVKRSIWKLKSGESSGVSGYESGYKKFIVWYGGQVWSQETGEELSLYLYIRKEARICVKTNLKV